MRVRKSTCRGVSRPRYVPPSGFGYPLDGLLLPSPCRPCFVPTALLGFDPSELSPLTRSPNVSARMDPHAVSPAGTAVAETTTRLRWPRLLGFVPCENPSRPDVCLARGTAGCSLGLFPFQGFPATALNEIAPALLSRAFPSPRRSKVPPAPQSIIGSRFAPPTLVDKSSETGGTTLLGFPHLLVPEHMSDRPLGLCVHLVP
jgi:hypothetical protein